MKGIAVEKPRVLQKYQVRIQGAKSSRDGETETGFTQAEAAKFAYRTAMAIAGSSFPRASREFIFVEGSYPQIRGHRVVCKGEDGKPQTVGEVVIEKEGCWERG